MKKETWLRIFHVVAAMALAFGLVIVGAAVAEKYRWPIVHTWALMHGAIFVIFPAYFLIFYLVLHPVVATWAAAPDTNEGKRVSKLAVWSLVLSGLGLSFLPLVGGGVGIVLGHCARKQCREHAEYYGSGIALAGLILGYAAVAMALYLVAALVWVFYIGHGG